MRDSKVIDASGKESELELREMKNVNVRENEASEIGNQMDFKGLKNNLHSLVVVFSDEVAESLLVIRPEVKVLIAEDKCSGSEGTRKVQV